VSESIALQLATHEKFSSFTATQQVPGSGGVILAFAVASREEADRLADAALLSGGGPTKETTDLGWLYNRGFADPDGHHFEAVHLDMAATATPPA
jgi:predicted lactoylglutathione lyase